MKRYILPAIILIPTFIIGFYLGYSDSVSDPAVATQEQALTNQSNETEEATKLLKQELAAKEKELMALKEAMTQKDETIQSLSNSVNNTIAASQTTVSQPKASQPKASQPTVSVDPASDYDRGNYVTNLVHFFNSGKDTTQVSDIKCEANSCQLTANISAGSKTNPEIADLMRFFDEHSKSGLYTRVGLSSVTKKDGKSEVVLALSL